MIAPVPPTQRFTTYADANWDRNFAGARAGVSGSFLSTGSQPLVTGGRGEIYGNASLGNLGVGGRVGLYRGNIGIDGRAIATTGRAGMDVHIPISAINRTLTVSPSIYGPGFGGEIGLEVDPRTMRVRKRRRKISPLGGFGVGVDLW